MREGLFPSRGGAVPKWPMGLVELIIEMLGWVRDAMDELDGDRKAIVMADRGNRQLAQAAGRP